MKTLFSPHAKVVGAYLFLALIMTLPVALNLSSKLAGTGGDPWQTMWRFETQALEISDGTFWNSFWGGGEPRLVNYSPLIWMPIHWLFGQPTSYNIVWILSFVLSGYFMFLLVRHLVGEKYPAAAFIAGLYYMFLPFHLAHSFGHFGAMQLQWLPLAALLLLKILEKPTYRNSIGLAFVLLIQLWAEHHYFVWLGIFFLIFLFFKRKQANEIISQKRALPILLGAMLFLVLAIPTYSPTLRLAFADASPLSLGEDQAVRFSADLLSFIFPAEFHSLVGGMSKALTHFNGNVAESTHYLGLIALLLIIFFRQKIPVEQKKIWLTVGVIFLVLSLGPVLQVFGKSLPIPLPFALLDNLPVFSAIRAIGRASVMTGVAVSVLLGWVVATQIKTKKWQAILAGFILLDFLAVPMAMQATAAPQVYREASQLSGERIIEIPAATNYGIASRSLYFSNQTQKEVVGNIALERAFIGNELTEATTFPILRQIVFLRTGHLEQFRPDFFAQEPAETMSDITKYLDISGAIIHQDSLTVSQKSIIDSFLAKLGLVKTSVDDSVLYDFTPLRQRQSDGVFLTRDEGWQVGYDARIDTTFAELHEQGKTTVHNISDEPQIVNFNFQVAPNAHGNMIVRLNDEVVADLAVVANEAASFRVELKPGVNVLTWRNRLPEKAIIMNPSYEVIDR